jgi:hypothetical protein
MSILFLSIAASTAALESRRLAVANLDNTATGGFLLHASLLVEKFADAFRTGTKASTGTD